MTTPCSAIAEDILQYGYSVTPAAVPEIQVDALYRQLLSLHNHQFTRAGIGRDQNHLVDDAIRRDRVCWISGETEAERQWLDWADSLKTHLNRELLLGLFSFESMFSHYPPGAFYKTHVDAFRGEANRMLSLVLYLNRDWRSTDGGELVIYPPGREPVIVLPEFGTLVTFLSEEFPHEVLPTQRDRYAVAGWFRLNTSMGGRIDPPT